VMSGAEASIPNFNAEPLIRLPHTPISPPPKISFVDETTGIISRV